jgi:hypothetical protein
MVFWDLVLFMFAYSYFSFTESGMLLSSLNVAFFLAILKGT